MYNNLVHTKNNKNEKVIKLYTWIAYDLWLYGLITYNWLAQIQSVITSIDIIEKAILTSCTVVFAAYRIYILHLDAKKKKLENEEKEMDISERRNPKKSA